ncbi:MAG: glycosyltransferase [Candidatus Omnitrophota bacterium]
MTKVAVIIPVSKPEHFPLCINGIIRQNFSPAEFEIILVKSKELVLELPRCEVKIAQIEENNLHPGFRRNLAVKNTNARILAFLDDDAIPCPDWLAHALRYIQQEQFDGISGPVRQSGTRLSFLHTLAGAANESVFLEGVDHFTQTCDQLNFYQIPFCNVIMKRQVWESVGGINELANYYIDDTEFFYIATKKGYKFKGASELSVQHITEPFSSRYLKKKFISRFYTGLNLLSFRKIYKEIPLTRSFVFIPLAAVVSFIISNNYFMLRLFLLFYFLTAFWFSRLWLAKNKGVFLLLPAVFFVSQSTIFVALISGMLYFFVNKRKILPLMEYEKQRLRDV